MPIPLLSAMDEPALLIEYPSPKAVVYDQKMRDRLINAILKGMATYEQ